MAFTFPFYLIVASAFFFLRVDFYSKNLKKIMKTQVNKILPFLLEKTVSSGQDT